MITLLFEELINHFTLEKDHKPSHVNELLDFVQKRYIQGELSIVEYKKLFFELDKRNAEKPHSFIFNINQTHLQKVELPG